MRSRALVFAVIFAAVLLASYLSTTTRLNPAQRGIRNLGLYYLNNSYFGTPSAKSPEAVTAIVWDYRGLDTIYETTVFFLAVIGGLALFRLEKTTSTKPSTQPGSHTVLVKQATKLLVVMIVAVSASIALHGHLTPGGGFQGGATLAVAPLLIIAAFNRYVLENRGVSYIRAVIARSTSLACLWLVAFLPLLAGYYLLQNQPFYPFQAGGQLISGSLFFYNLFEYIAVASGFTAIFLYLSLPEEVYRKEIGGIQR